LGYQHRPGWEGLRRGRAAPGPRVREAVGSLHPRIDLDVESAAARPRAGDDRRRSDRGGENSAVSGVRHANDAPRGQSHPRGSNQRVRGCDRGSAHVQWMRCSGSDAQVSTGRGAAIANRMTFQVMIELVARCLEGMGIAVVFAGGVAAIVNFARRLIAGDAFEAGSSTLRERLARATLLGLEFLVAADIIAT